MNPTPTMTPSTSPSNQAGRGRRGRRPRKEVFTGLDLKPDQINNALRAVLDGSKVAVTTLTPHLPPAFLTGKVVDAVGASGGEFTVAMASLQEQFGPALGHLPSDPKAMRGNVALASAAKAAAAPLRVLVVLLDNVANYADRQAAQDARTIYQHAAVAANLNPALATAIAPFRAARARQGKKAASTRVRNAQVRDVAPPPPAAPLPSSSTTVTTTQR